MVHQSAYFTERVTGPGARARSQAALGLVNARLVLFDSSNRLVDAPSGAPAQRFRDVAYCSDTGNYLLLQDVPGAVQPGAPAGACLWHCCSDCF